MLTFDETHADDIFDEDNTHEPSTGRELDFASLNELSMRGSGSPNKQDFSITVKNGVAVLAGKTGSTAQTNMIEDLVARVNGVKQIVNMLSDEQPAE